MSYKIAPAYGRTNPLIYLSICSTAGSLTVISVKASGIALKLSFAGNNQFSHPSTYIFIVLSVICILTQMNYFNKALAHFPTNMYVFIGIPVLLAIHLYCMYRDLETNRLFFSLV